MTTTTSRFVEMSFRNQNPNPVIDVRPGWQWCMRSTFGRKMIPDNYAFEVLNLLIPEFDFTDTKQTDTKISDILKKKKLGDFHHDMISILREFKNVVQAELHQASKSQYFTHTHGQYCDIRDFDLDKLGKDMAGRFPSISQSVIDRFLPNATFYYYLK